MTGLDVPVFALVIAILAGLISLDATAVAQCMISQPLVACPLIGMAAGDLPAGVTAGIAFQLLFVSDMPVGSHLPVDASLVSMGALSAALVCRRIEPSAGDTALAASSLLAVFLAPLCVLACRASRRLNNTWNAPVVKALRDGRRGKALLMAQGGILVFFARGFLCVFVYSLAAGWLLARGVPGLSPDLSTALRWSFALLPLVGMAHFLAGQRLTDVTRRVPGILLSTIFRTRGEAT